MKLYRYFPLGTDVFAGISDLQITSVDDYERYRHLLPRVYTRRYIQQRLETERKIYDLFITKGGTPRKKHPYYLTLGNCDQWFFEEKHCFGSLLFDIEEFDSNTVSFTYGDSIPTFMDEFEDGKEYRKNVYTLQEIMNLIQKYGYPQKWNPFGEKGPENYIEAQIWSDEPIKNYRPNKYQSESDALNCVPLIASRMMYARGFADAEQRSYRQCIEKARKNPWWTWVSSRIKQVDIQAFSPNPIHGIAHGQKCALIALVIASFEGFDEMDTKTLVLAALYHDIGRRYYDNGRSHGQIGADKVGQYIDPGERIHMDTLEEAIRFHDTPDTSCRNEILVRLKDVDTLDYLRLGFGVYEPRFLRTAEARKLVRFALELNIYTYLDPGMILKLMCEGEKNGTEYA